MTEKHTIKRMQKIKEMGKFLYRCSCGADILAPDKESAERIHEFNLSYEPTLLEKFLRKLLPTERVENNEGAIFYIRVLNKRYVFKIVLVNKEHEHVGIKKEVKDGKVYWKCWCGERFQKEKK